MKLSPSFASDVVAAVTKRGVLRQKERKKERKKPLGGKAKANKEKEPRADRKSNV